MSGTTEAFAQVEINVLLKDMGWHLTDGSSVLFEHQPCTFALHQGPLTRSPLAPVLTTSDACRPCCGKSWRRNGRLRDRRRNGLGARTLRR